MTDDTQPVETPEQIAAAKKQAADNAVIQLAAAAVQMAEQSDDPRLKAIEAVALQQLGVDVRVLLKAAVGVAQPHTESPQEMASRQQRDMMDTNKAFWQEQQKSIQQRRVEMDALIQLIAKQMLES